MSGARRMYLHVSRALFDLPPDRRPEALAALASCHGPGERIPGAVTIGAEVETDEATERRNDGSHRVRREPEER